MLRLEKVNKYYQSGSEKIHAIKEMNLTFPEKGLVFIIGPSGCGKSTLLNLLGGLDRPDSGEIFIEDTPISKFTNSQLNNYLNSYLGFVFQEYNILPDLNLYQNISLPLEMQNYSKKEIKTQVEKILDDVDLKNLGKRKINQLSGGQRQRIAIARALIKNPKMIIADEPTGNLDSVTSETIFKIFKKLSSERLIIIVSHDEESAYQYGDRIITIDDGKIVNDSNPKLVSLNSEKLVLKKAHVPLQTSIKLSLKNVWKKKFRFLVMTFICALSLAFLSFTIELSDDKLRQNAYTTIENGYNYTTISEKTVLPDTYVKSSVYDDYLGHSLPSNSYQKISEANPDLTIHQYQAVNIKLDILNNADINLIYPGTINTVIKYDSKNNYDLLAGRLPKDDTKEVLVTDYLIEMFKHFNIYPDCNTIYDYINCFIDLGIEENYRIVGVIKTNHHKWNSLIKNSASSTIDITDKLYYSFNNDFRIMNAIYLPEKYFNIEKANPLDKIVISSYASTVTAQLAEKPQNEEIDLNSYTTVINDLPLKNIALSGTSSEEVGVDISDDNEIIISEALLIELIGRTFNSTNGYEVRNAWREVENKMLSLKVYDSNKNLISTIELKIVGLSTSLYRNVLQVSDNVQKNIYGSFSSNEYMLAELPNNQEATYKLFKSVAETGYILDIFAYQADIDSFVIDPFIDLVSKIGLFVFAIFTIGVLWTIISIEIVDSKKEIGIFRSIGLSGFKVSFIFIFQTLVVNLIAYGLSLLGGYFAISYYNSTLMDELRIVNLSMYMLTYRSPVYLIIFLIIITAVAITIPLYRIMSQKIIDVISERDKL